MKKRKVKIKDFHIETFDGGAYLHFFTQAENHKKALKRLISESLDYKRIANKDRDTTITIKLCR